MRPDANLDQRVRDAAFRFLEQLAFRCGDVVPARDLRRGFEYEGRRVPLMGPQGIFKPAVLDLPLSITTVPLVPGRDPPYEDEVGGDGLISYRYRGDDPRHRDNRGLRELMLQRLPLVYLYGVQRGRYLPHWPVFIVGDDPRRLTFTVAVDDPLASDAEAPYELPEDARRAYLTRLARQRLHQVAFRHRVLRAYRESCAMCRLHHPELLDAAHIVPDGHPRGLPVTPNGLALCKLHHAAFDRHIVGVRPDLVIELRRDLRLEVDGPMLRHGLQELHGARLRILPRAQRDQPDASLLEERYALFRSAS